MYRFLCPLTKRQTTFFLFRFSAAEARTDDLAKIQAKIAEGDAPWAKFAMNVKALVTFRIQLLDSTLPEQLGPLEADTLRAMYV